MSHGWEPKYPVKWRDADGKEELLHLGDLSAGIKRAFVNRAKQHILMDAEGWMPAAHLVALRTELAAGSEYWTEDSCTSGVAIFLGSKEGDLALNRLLFGESAKAKTDAELDQLIQEKCKDEASDYRQAMKLIRSEADPKASGGGPAKTATTASTTNSAATPGAGLPTGSTA